MVCCCIWAIDCFCCCCPSTLPTVRLSSSCLLRLQSRPVFKTVSEWVWVQKGKKANERTNATMKYSFTTPGTLTGSGEGQEKGHLAHISPSLFRSLVIVILFMRAQMAKMKSIWLCALSIKLLPPNYTAAKVSHQHRVAAAQAGQTCLSLFLVFINPSVSGGGKWAHFLF